MKPLPLLFPTVTVTILYFRLDPAAQEPEFVWVKVESEGQELDMSQETRWLEVALDSLLDVIRMYRAWAEQDSIIGIARERGSHGTERSD
jgi:hypothetical protein